MSKSKFAVIGFWPVLAIAVTASVLTQLVMGAI